MPEFVKMCKNLENKVKSSYEEGTTVVDAEKLSGEFLRAQMMVSDELKSADLDSRMRKSGVKAIRAAVYKDICSKSEKKPTEGALDHELNSHEIIIGEQESFDKAEVERDNLERYYQIFREAHIYYRGIAKGRFE